MAYLINRTPPARLRCIHSLLKFAFNKFWFSDFFMWDLLYNSETDNIHNYCSLIKNDKELNISYCPFLQNPLSSAGCYLTRSIIDDTTKRKEISNSVNSLDALWLINRSWRKLKVTDFGKLFTETDFQDDNWLELARKAICNYWPAIGLLYQIYKKDNLFNLNELHIWYPETDEFISIEWEKIQISSWSKWDSNTRTKSCIIAWFTTVWFIVPNSMKDNVEYKNSQNDTNSYMINQSIRNDNKYIKVRLPNIFSGNFVTKNPLDYDNLTKDNKALRENWQELSRQLTMKNAHIIRNRRFVLLYLLNYCFDKKGLLDFNKLLYELKKHKDFFIINEESFEKVMLNELWIAELSWIPFEIIDSNFLKPITGLNTVTLSKWAPQELIYLIDKSIKENVCKMSI